MNRRYRRWPHRNGGPWLRLSRATERREREDGQALVLFALFLSVFMLAAALTADWGFWNTVRRNYQNVADSAALAGAAYLTRPVTSTARDYARRAAWESLNTQLNLGLSSGQLNSYSNANTAAGGQVVNAGGDPFTLWVSTPPNGSGSAAAMSTVASSTGVVFARVDRPNGSFFARVAGITSRTISAWATAGNFPNKWAVITLRRGRGGTQIDAGPANTTDIKIAGSTSFLTVLNGDVGGNWGLKTSGSSDQLRIGSTNGDEDIVYLIDWTSCGNSCWTNGQIADLSGNSLAGTYPPNGAKKLPGFIVDPNYQAPPGLNSGALNGPVITIPTILAGTTVNTCGGGSPVTDVCIKSSVSPGSVVSDGSSTTCSADSPRIGPGYYTSISVENGKCLILDPLHHYANPNTPAVSTPVLATEQPGVFYVTGATSPTTKGFNIGNSALIVGDGVTIVMRSLGGNDPNGFSPNSGGAMDLNTGKGRDALNGTTGAAGLKKGAWTSKAVSSYTWGGTSWAYISSTQGVGIAMYVLKPNQQAGGSSVFDANTTVIQVSSGAALAWSGITYAPHDNVAIGGQPNHNAVGQLISWTFTFNGGANVTQTYDGPDMNLPYLIEPCVTTGGGCQ